MRVAVLAYGSWARAEENPPEVILRALEARGCDVVAVEPHYVPVDGAGLLGRVEAVLDGGPDALIGIGLAAGSAAIRMETTAINMRDYRVPDVRGAQPRGEVILPGGPVGYASDLPNGAIVEALRGAEIPAVLSHSAGTHCCNQMLYLARHLVEQRGLATRCGFMHVPFTHANMARSEPGTDVMPSMALGTLVDALEIVLGEVARS